jgi:hypothetical protein
MKEGVPPRSDTFFFSFPVTIAPTHGYVNPDPYGFKSTYPIPLGFHHMLSDPIPQALP